MKLSAWHKDHGDHVMLNNFDTYPDKVYVSVTFTKNEEKARSIEWMFDCPVEFGGCGYSLHKRLPEDVEHICPDYDLYGIDYSMGFTSRGCVRNCGFCIVPEKEGKIHDHAHLDEFLMHDKLVLLDNSFLQSPLWEKNLQRCIDDNIKLNICQGIDVRLLNEQQARMLAEAKLYNHNFTSKALHFAWDFPQHEAQVRRGIELLLSAGIRPQYCVCYVLVGYNTTHDEDLHRVHTLWNDYGVLPFVMRYNERRDDKVLNDLARWCNNRWLFKSCTFDEYRKGKE